MKKIIGKICAVILAATAAAAAVPPALAESRLTDYGRSDIYYESFDSGYGNFESLSVWLSTTKSEIVDSGYRGKAVRLKNVKEYQSIHSTVNIDANRRYKVSYWVKGESSYSGMQSCLVFKKDGLHTNSLNADSTAPMANYEYVGLDSSNKGKELTNEWQYIEEIICFKTSGMTDEKGTTDIYPVLFNLNTVTTSSTKRTYMIDELKIEPLDIVENGNMSDISGFTLNSNTNAYVTDENDNNVLVMTNKGSGGADLSFYADVREGETYKISYRAKTVAGTNVSQVLFSRDSGLYTEKPTPLYESVPKDNLTNEWKTYSHEFTSQVQTTESLAYRYPLVIFRVINQGTVYVDDLKIEKINPRVKNIKISGSCQSGETVNVSFAGNGTDTYQWRMTDRDYYQTISEGTSQTSAFSVTIPSGYENVILGITPIAEDGSSGTEEMTEINGIVTEQYSVNKACDEQEIGVSFPDTVWAPDFENVSTEITVKNKQDNLTGYLAVYDNDKNLIRVGLSSLSEGENSISASAESGTAAKVFVFDENLKPKAESTKIDKDNESEFIYVDSNAGDDYNPGTYTEPLKTLEKAKEQARAKSADASDIYVMMKSGVYDISSTVSFTAEDSGINGNIIYASYGGANGEKAVLSGGKKIEGWSIYDADKNIYRAKVADSSITNFRQLYVNGIRAVRAKTDALIQSVSKDDTGYVLTDTSLVNIENVADVEFVYYYQWTNPRCKIDSVTQNSDGTISVDMSDYCWNLFRNKSYLQPEDPAYMENAYEFIDMPGEWYFNKSDGYVYYKPRTFEDMTSAEVIVPVTETLISVDGTYAAPVKNITFKNLGFSYSTWLYPDTYGYSDAQAGKLRNGNGKGDDVVPDAAVEATHANNVNFEDCSFNKLGMSGLSMMWGIENCRISGNKFSDISGSGVYLGTPYKDSDCTDWRNSECRDIYVSDNYFCDVAIDYKSCVPISTIHMYDTDVCHNEIYNVPYSGIHGESGISTDRTGHRYNYNYLHRVLNDKIYDGGSIYVTGASGADDSNLNEIKGNYIKEQLNSFAALYTDNKSNGWKLSENVVDFSMLSSWGATNLQWILNLGTKDIYFDNNYTTTDGMDLHKTNWEDSRTQEELITNTHLYPDADWPADGKNIISNAGMPGAFSARLADKYQLTKSADKEITLKNGMTKQLNLYGEGGKNGVYDAQNIAAVTSLTPDTVTAEDNGRITGKNAGDGCILIYTLSDGCLRTEKVNVKVY